MSMCGLTKINRTMGVLHSRKRRAYKGLVHHAVKQAADCILGPTYFNSSATCYIRIMRQRHMHLGYSSAASKETRQYCQSLQVPEVKELALNQ